MPTPKGEVEGNLAGDLQAHTQEEVEKDLARGISMPTPRGGGSIPSCTEADPIWLLLRALCILLECILVVTNFIQTRMHSSGMCITDSVRRG